MAGSKRMQITQGLRRAVQINSDGIATMFGARTHTWKQFSDRVQKMAGAIRRLGLEDGDRVAILALNSDRYLEYYFFVPMAGGVVVPLNIRWAGPENLFALNDSQTRILFVDRAFAPVYDAIKDNIDTVEHVVFIDDGEAPSGMLSFEKILDAAEPAKDADRKGDDLAGIYYTGGTTGRSKGVMLSHRNIYFNAVNAVQTFNFHIGTRWLHSAPMFHLADGSATVAITMMGASHCFIPGFDAEGVLKAIEAYKPNHCLFLPTMLGMLLKHPNFDNFDVSSVQEVLYGASPMPEAILREAMKRVKGWRFTHAYGMTELSPVATALPWDEHILEGPGSERLKSCGVATVGCEVLVVNEEGKEVPPNTVGEIIVRGDNVMLGYWKQPDVTAATLKDGWMWTGDAATMDEGGYFYIVDRVKDMIISGGENVYSAEVEQAVYEHPDVAECAAIGVPDDSWGERVHAIIVPKPDTKPTEQEIIDHCHTLIGGYKCPRSVSFRDETLPLSGAGKILKTELRKPYWEGRSKNVN